MASQDYTYDNNGNLLSDGNKGISGITYNLLNLPETITVTSKGTITYTYASNGTKLAKQVYDAVTTVTTTTNYISGFEYNTNDSLRQFAHEEGRVRHNPDGYFVYDYYERDHLGSVRVTLTEEETVDVYSRIGMEPEDNEKESAYFYHVNETRKAKPSAHPKRDSTDRFAAALDGKLRKLGPAILLKVNTGDRINMSVDAWYGTDKKDKPGKELIATAISSGIGKNAAETGVKSANAASPLAGGVLLDVLTSLLSVKGKDPSVIDQKPKAYLNWILLDASLKPYPEDTLFDPLKRGEYKGFLRVGNAGELKTLIKNGWKVPKSGFVYIFTNNDSEEEEVFFDNMMMSTVSGPLLEVNHTYPFGLTIAGISSTAPGKMENKNRFNGGNELQHGEFSDGSGLEMYDAHFRMYDAQIGRFNRVDPFSDFGHDLSPYIFANNNPILLNDPLGLIADSISIDKKGNVWYHLPEVIVKAKSQKEVSKTKDQADLIHIDHLNKAKNAQVPLPIPAPLPIPLPLGIPLVESQDEEIDEAGPLGINWLQISRDINDQLMKIMLTTSIQLTILLSSDERTADQILPGSLKRSPSYNPKYGNKTRSELEKLARQGDQAAKKMKKLIDQVDRLLQKNKNK